MRAIAAPPGADPSPAGPAAVDRAGHEALVRMLSRLGLTSSARLVLDTLRPVGWLGGQALWLAQPLAALFGAGGRVGRLARTLEDDTAFSALLAELQPPAAEDAP